jgi:hypothetical protein
MTQEQQPEQQRFPLQFTVSTSLEELVDLVSNAIDADQAPLFIAMLEKSYGNWEVTEKLMKHFKAVELDYNKGFTEDEREDLSPKLIKTPPLA